MSGRILIRGGWVLTLGTRTPNYAVADVLIENDRITEVGPGIRARGAEIIDGTTSIVMPGFVDSHRHVSRSLFKNLDEEISISAEHFQPEDVYAATLVGLLGAVEAGITLVVDWADLPEGLSAVEAALQAHHDSGLRTVFVHSGRHDVGGNTTFAFGSSDPLQSNIEQISHQWQAARGSGLRIHAHVGRHPEDRDVVSAMGHILGDDVTFVHCAHLSEKDFDAVAASKASVCLTPASEMAGGMGSPPIQQLVDRGIRPGLGVDDESVAPGDMFAQMRAVNSMQHAKMFDLKLAGKAGLPTLLNTRDVIRYATLDGAFAVGLGTLTGSIEPGKKADMILLRADRPNIAPINDAIGAVVWGMDTSNISWVIAGGQVLMRDGAQKADTQLARSRAMSARRRVAKAAGLLAEAGATQ